MDMWGFARFPRSHGATLTHPVSPIGQSVKRIINRMQRMNSRTPNTTDFRGVPTPIA